MKHCVPFPEENFLIVRPSLVAICLANRPAAKLLSALLFRANVCGEQQADTANRSEGKSTSRQICKQEGTFRLFRTQAQLAHDMCGEITEKTLHDTAIPMLQLLGFLQVEERPGCHCYVINLGAVKQAIMVYTQKAERLERFLFDAMPLEPFRIGPDELETALVNKKYFHRLLGKILLTNRMRSHCQRGPKTHREARSEGKNAAAKNQKEDSQNHQEAKGTNDKTLAQPTQEQIGSPLPEHSSQISEPGEQPKQANERRAFGASVHPTDADTASPHNPSP